MYWIEDGENSLYDRGCVTDNSNSVDDENNGAGLREMFLDLILQTGMTREIDQANLLGSRLFFVGAN